MAVTHSYAKETTTYHLQSADISGRAVPKPDADLRFVLVHAHVGERGLHVSGQHGECERHERRPRNGASPTNVGLKKGSVYTRIVTL